MELSQYMQELSKVKLLEPEREKALWRAWKEDGDEEARRTLIESYQPLVFKQAMPFRQSPCVLDLIQEGTVGLIEAAESFDPSRGVAFSLYGIHRIRGRILNYLKKEGNIDIACLEGAVDSEKRPLQKEQLPDHALSVAEQAEQHELARQLHHALDRLPKKEKAALEGYMMSEDAAVTADALDVSTSHIYRLQKNGIRRVRGMLSRFMHYW